MEINAGRDEEIKDARATLTAARGDEEKARKALIEARLKTDRQQRFYRRSKGQAEAARSRDDYSRRMASESRGKAEDARRKNQPQHRFEAEARRWDTEHRLASQDTRRWEEDARRKEREAKSYALELRDRMEDVQDQTHEAHKSQQRFEYLTKFGAAPAGGVPDQSEADSAALTITERTTATLRSTLDGAEHRPDQLLRLTVGTGGEVVLVLDTIKQGDNVVSHQGQPVLLVEPVLLQGLGGKKLDVTEGAGKANIILSG